MSESIRIVGQGIAGSLLAVACEKAGIEFEIYDQGHENAASRVGAGLVSPLTGRRLVPTWRFADWRDQALQIYRDLELELARPLVREMVIHRRYRDDAQRELFEARCEVPQVAAWVTKKDEAGLWMKGAIQVETGELIRGLRERWQQQGRLKSETINLGESSDEQRTIWCVGAAMDEVIPLAWHPSRGQIVRGRIDGLDADTLLNDGQWLLPSESSDVRVGSTFDRHDLRLRITESDQEKLCAAAVRLSGQELQDPTGDVGLRMAVPDQRPVVGWVDEAQRRGVLGGLAAKGALWAPVLAQQWAADQLCGDQIDSEAHVDRFGDRRGL